MQIYFYEDQYWSMFICKAKFKGIIDKIAYFYKIFMCFLKILLVWTFKGWTKSIKEYSKYLNLFYKHEQKFNKLMMTICILGWTNDFKYIYIYIYIYSIKLKNKIIITPEAKVVMAGSFAVSCVTPFFLALVLLRVPVGKNDHWSLTQCKHYTRRKNWHQPP